MNIIDMNYDISLCDNHNYKSFIWRLHERWVFDIILLNELIFDIINIIKQKIDKDDIDILKKINFLQWKLCDIYSFTLECLHYHFSKDDLYKIKKLDKHYWIYIQRLKFVIESFVYQDYQRIVDYEDDLGKLV